MTRQKLDKILFYHAGYIKNIFGSKKANLRGANLSYANLSGANLRGANLDYSVLPLWCGSLKIGKVDVKLMYQVLAHAAAICNSCDDKEAINVQNYLLKFISKSHIAEYCKHIKKRNHTKSNNA